MLSIFILAAVITIASATAEAEAKAEAKAEYYGGSGPLHVTHIEPRLIPKYELAKSSYGVLPSPSYGPPKLEYGLPKAEYGLPKAVYGPPKAEYGLPKAVYGLPKVEYGPPKLEYGIGIHEAGKHHDLQCYPQTAYETIYKTKIEEVSTEYHIQVRNSSYLKEFYAYKFMNLKEYRGKSLFMNLNINDTL